MSASRNIAAVTISLLALTTSQAVLAEENIQEKETVEVIGITPTHGVGLPEELIPFNVQSANSKDLDNSQSLDLTDFMNRNLGSVTINEAQNNPLQPDVQYRGFTLSPLLGLPQGLAVYQNGVRINEPFGDSMNWDILPESSIGSMNLIGGANPVFGLNSLGGALSITTKNGFTHPGHNIETYGGSFERVVSTIESGLNNGTWGYFFTGSYFDEEGWRDASPSDALNFFGSVSYRNEDSTLDLSLNHGDTDLIGNASSPVELIELDREAVFTSPDKTQNNLVMVNLEGTHWLNDLMQLGGNIFYRKNDTDTFNGDGSEFTDCGGANAGRLCEEDDLTAPITDHNGAFILETVGGIERNAINNISNREQEGFGSNLQTTFLNDLFGYKNQLIFGAGYQQGLIDFISIVEIASLNCTAGGTDCTLADADRSTVGTDIFVPGGGTKVKSHNRNWSLYFTDTFQLNDKFSLTASARYNNTHIVLGDRSTESTLVTPDDPAALQGEHDFDRINPSLGMTYSFSPTNNMYGSYSESSRAPTPIELLCADPSAPCSLPNAFLADPPLEQVVTKSWEGGFRGSFINSIDYQLGFFHATNNNDIVFTSTGGVGSNEGFFKNVGDTRRLGTEVGLSGNWNKLQWFTNYSYIEATFRTPFQAASANHPNADANSEIAVEKGDHIPGIPEHNIKIGGLYAFNNKFSVGGNMTYNSSQYIRGDEGNLLDTIDGYAVVNINGTYKVNKIFSVFARVNNLFDTDYESFGLLGEADEVFDGSGATAAFTNPIFLGVGAPISGFVGISATF
jgi:iron complex outermembrane recepter protein